jgi:hypothetical protein
MTGLTPRSLRGRRGRNPGILPQEASAFGFARRAWRPISIWSRRSTSADKPRSMTSGKSSAFALTPGSKVSLTGRRLVRFAGRMEFRFRHTARRRRAGNGSEIPVVDQSSTEPRPAARCREPNLPLPRPRRGGGVRQDERRLFGRTVFAPQRTRGKLPRAGSAP